MKQDELTRGQISKGPMKQGPVEKGQNGSGLSGLRPNWLRTNWEDPPDNEQRNPLSFVRKENLRKAYFILPIPLNT